MKVEIIFYGRLEKVMWFFLSGELAYHSVPRNNGQSYMLTLKPDSWQNLMTFRDHIYYCFVLKCKHDPKNRMIFEKF